ncbi:smoothened homolog [Galendromus occidentalis]|uniref:Smoothened homolog n=1 Tax=Galendromus occidentalis TaxID=34638 RepID=A0AAJ6QXH9_9ACAR|nr:smoothened homolog [Galendromus occidentalis]
MRFFASVLTASVCVLWTEAATHDAISGQKKADCDHPAKCEVGENLTCFHNTLSYSSTSLELVDDVENLLSVDEKLEQWKTALSRIPRCWRLVQPLLCSLYRPPCTNGSVPLPSYILCDRARTACRIAATRGIQWPHFLSCERDIFRKECKHDVKTFRIPSNVTRECMSPLVYTANQESWYPEIDECGISCRQHPLLSTGEQSSMHEFVVWITALSATCCLLSVATYLTDWESSKKYPAVTGFYVSVCLLIVCVGYSAQFFVGADGILCKKDGTIRQGEPNAEENFACLTVFIACYYFLFAALAWIVVMCYAWSESLLRSSSRGGISEGHTTHIIAWSIPFMLTLTAMAVSEVEADSVLGICFVSQNSIYARLGFVLLPSSIGILFAFALLARLEYKLMKLKSKSYDENTQRSALDDKTLENVEKAIRWLCIVLVFLSLLLLVNLYCHIYEFRHASAWRRSLREHLSCRANLRHNSGELFNNEIVTCEPKSKPSIAMLKIHLSVFLFACVANLLATLHLVATDAWTTLRKKIGDPPAVTSRHLKKKNLIADAFEILRREQEAEEEDGAPDSVSQSFQPGWPGVLQPLRVVPSPAMIARRYSSTSDVSRQAATWAQTMARKRKTRKERDRHRVVEKTTSTGDLGGPYGVTTPLIPQIAAALPMVNKCFTNKKNLINPPFTHGMSGESRNNNLSPFRPKFPSISPRSVSQSPLKAVYATPSTQAPIAYIPPMFPVLNPYTGYPINPYSPFYMPPPHMMATAMCNEFVPFPDVDNIKSPLIPLRAHETGSEASFKMPLPSDTEYDTEAYRPQTAIPRDARQPRSGKLSVMPKKTSGFFSS